MQVVETVGVTILATPSPLGMIVLGAFVGVVAFASAWAVLEVTSRGESVRARTSVVGLQAVRPLVVGSDVMDSQLWGSVPHSRDDITVTPSALPTCGAGMTLVGTVVTSAPEARSLALVATTDRRPIPLGIGAVVAGHEVAEVTPYSVRLVRDGTQCRVHLFSPGSGPRGEPASEIQERGGGIRGVPRALIRRAMTGSLDSDVRLIPGGGGVRVFGLRRDDPARRLGLVNGDTIVAVSGHSLDDTHALLELVATLETLSEITLSVERRGGREELRYAIMD